ncbi:MAG: AbrB/MazE/SpoVT family DNA-binding domain-containing protein [Candidatus Omnitrophota bacterium]|nr:AbrB/MazE/SpoVT family DNA-binding domain-containing protein [Candidatus Omnitrophota bacterium]
MKKSTKKHTTKSGYIITIVSSRGQVTIPQEIRDRLHIGKGSLISFEPMKRGVLILPMKVEPQDPYTEEEWNKIEKLSETKGKTFDNSEDAKKFISKL